MIIFNLKIIYLELIQGLNGHLGLLLHQIKVILIKLRGLQTQLSLDIKAERIPEPHEELGNGLNLRGDKGGLKFLRHFAHALTFKNPLADRFRSQCDFPLLHHAKVGRQILDLHLSGAKGRNHDILRIHKKVLMIRAGDFHSHLLIRVVVQCILVGGELSKITLEQRQMDRRALFRMEVELVPSLTQFLMNERNLPLTVAYPLRREKDLIDLGLVGLQGDKLVAYEPFAIDEGLKGGHVGQRVGERDLKHGGFSDLAMHVHGFQGGRTLHVDTDGVPNVSGRVALFLKGDLPRVDATKKRVDVEKVGRRTVARDFDLAGAPSIDQIGLDLVVQRLFQSVFDGDLLFRGFANIL